MRSTILNTQSSRALLIFLVVSGGCAGPEDIPTVTSAASGSEAVSATASALSSANCAGQVNGLYCGNDGLGGDPNVLYRCTNSVASVAEVCSYNCFVLPPGHNDVCEAAAPAAESHQVNQLTVLVRGRDNQVWYRSWNPGWTDWTPFGGGFISGPSAVGYVTCDSFVCFPPIIDVYGTGEDAQVWQRDSEEATWTAIPGGILTSAPSVTLYVPDTNVYEEMLARGTDDAIYLRSRHVGGPWTDWGSLAGGARSGPAAVSWGPGRLDVFVAGLDAQLWHRWWDDVFGWSDWEALGGMLTSAPAVTTFGPGRLDVFARGTDLQMWHKWFVGGIWSAWEPLGGYLLSGLGAVSWSPGRIDVLAIGGDTAVYHKWYEGGWSDWEWLGGSAQ
jgi:hypothetical protein